MCGVIIQNAQDSTCHPTSTVLFLHLMPRATAPSCRAFSSAACSMLSTLRTCFQQPDLLLLHLLEQHDLNFIITRCTWPTTC